MPSNLADAMIRLFDGSSNEGVCPPQPNPPSRPAHVGSTMDKPTLVTIHRGPGGGERCPPRPQSTI